MKRREFAIIVLFLVGVALGYFYGLSTTPTLKPESPASDVDIANNVVQGPLPSSLLSSITVGAPAIDQNGAGTILPITIQKRAGDGEVLTDIDDVVFQADTQQSIQTAKSVAEEVTGVPTDKINLVYVIKSNASLVGGPSAGAAITIATIAALLDEGINKSVMITGTINPDGSIGEVGGVTEKAKAAKRAGAALFLVPLGQSIENVSKPVESCTRRGRSEYCRVTYEYNTSDVSETTGIAVKEVASIEEAMNYFF